MDSKTPIPKSKSDCMYSVTWANWFEDWLKSRLYVVPSERKENKQAHQMEYTQAQTQTETLTPTPRYIRIAPKSKNEKLSHSHTHKRTHAHAYTNLYMQSTEQRANSAHTKRRENAEHINVNVNRRMNDMYTITNDRAKEKQRFCFHMVVLNANSMICFYRNLFSSLRCEFQCVLLLWRIFALK